MALNAITSLHGLQNTAYLIAVASFANKDEIIHTGYFLTLIGNLLMR